MSALPGLVTKGRLLHPVEGFLSCPACDDPRGLAADDEGRTSIYGKRGPLWTEDAEGTCPGCGALLGVTVDDDTANVRVLCSRCGGCECDCDGVTCAVRR